MPKPCSSAQFGCRNDALGYGDTEKQRAMCDRHLRIKHRAVFNAWSHAQIVDPFADEDPYNEELPGQELDRQIPILTVQESDDLVSSGDIITPKGRLIGRTEARLFTPPLRPLTRRTSLGYEVADFADQVLGEPLLPWQRWLVIHALELLPDGTPRFRTLLVLVARQNGKTSLSRTLALWKLYMRGARIVLGAAQDLSIAREVLELTNETVDRVSELAQEKVAYVTANGKECLRITTGKYIIKASNRAAGRSVSADHVTMDEIREQQNWAAWSAISKTITAREEAQIWALSNAGDKTSVVLNHLRTAAGVIEDENGVCVMGGPTTDDSLGLFEWSAREGCELDDTDEWCQSNPGLGYIITERAIRAGLNDPPDEFRTEVLCQHVEQLNGAFDLDAWRDCADSTGTLRSLRKRITLCIDASPDGKHVTAMGAAELPDGRYRVENLGTWRSIEEARTDLANLVAGVAPFRITWFPSGPISPLRAELKSLGTTDSKRIFYDLDPEIIELTGAEVSEACTSMAALIAGRRIVHSNDPLVNAHVSATRRLQSGDTWRFVRQGSGHIDASYATAGCLHALRTAPPERKVASFAY